MRRLSTLVNLLVTQTVVHRGRSYNLLGHRCLAPRLTSLLSRPVTSSGVCLTMARIKTMEEWSFSESKLASLPLDKQTENFTRQVNTNKLIFFLVFISI